MPEQTSEQKAAEMSALDIVEKKETDSQYQSEIDDLFDLKDEEKPAEEEKAEDVKEEEAKEETAEETAEEEEPKKKESGSDSTKQEDHSEEPSSEQQSEQLDTEESEVDFKKKYEDLLKQFTDDSETGLVGFKHDEPKEDKKPKEDEPSFKADVKVEGFKPFESQDDFQKAFENYEDYNKHMQGMIQFGVNKAVEEALRSLPGVANKLIADQIAIKNALDRFYTNNPEFVGFKKYIGQVGAIVERQHPELAGIDNIDKLLTEVEKEVRTRLKIDKRVTEITKTATNKATRGLAGKKSTGPAPLPKKPKGQAAEVADLFDDFNRS